MNSEKNCRVFSKLSFRRSGFYYASAKFSFIWRIYYYRDSVDLRVANFFSFEACRCVCVPLVAENIRLFSFWELLSPPEFFEPSRTHELLSTIIMSSLVRSVAIPFDKLLYIRMEL